MSDRQPAVAGTFYPGNRKELLEQLDGFLDGITVKQDCEMAISPHAGYEYSGRTAAHAIASLKGSQRFIILGASHYPLGPGFSIMSSGSWETPLGVAMVDREMASALMGKCSLLEEDSSAHRREHSIEVQIPFLQRLFPRFAFVPISVRNEGYGKGFLKDCEALGHAAALAAKAGAGIIASSDFSHYVSLEEAEMKEKPVLDAILGLDPAAFFRALKRTDASICGYGPIAATLYAARELGLRARLIHSSNSGEATGDSSEVVSYHAVGFHK